MTPILVVYESMFGNARAVAGAIAEGLRETVAVELLEVSHAPTVLEAPTTVVVGGPTHTLSMTRPSTRVRAAKLTQEPLVSRGIGLREWLTRVNARTDVRAAAFDTRLERPRWLRWFRSAAPKIEARLRALGMSILLPAESFLVTSETGPLLPRELERAREWGRALARAAQSVRVQGAATQMLRDPPHRDPPHA